MKVWRGILELNETVEAETEEEARQLLQAKAADREWTIWIERDDG